MIVADTSVQFSSTTRALPLDNYVTTVDREGTVVTRNRNPLRYGLRFQTASGEVLYFWTYRPRRVVDVLKRFGYAVID